MLTVPISSLAKGVPAVSIDEPIKDHYNVTKK